MYKNMLWLFCFAAASSHAFDVAYTPEKPTIDGLNQEAVWQRASWHAMDKLMVGEMPQQSDFSGRFRMLWDEQALYLQVEIIDDVLYDSHSDPLDAYWDDDALEIFVDEDASGGDHQYNHNAFAYHIGLDNQVADIATDKRPALYTDHVYSRWQRSSAAPFTIVWETAIYLYSDQFQDGKVSQPESLHKDKVIGFMLAYCDNDGSAEREHFVGSTAISPVNGDRNRGWIDASVFEKIVLTAP